MIRGVSGVSLKHALVQLEEPMKIGDGEHVVNHGVATDDTNIGALLTQMIAQQ